MLVTVWLDTARARPKSATLTVPLSLMMTFSGLTSRWIRPLAWASASARAPARARRGRPGAQRPLLVEHLAQGQAGDVLHREEDRAVVLALVVDGDDVGVGQGCRGARLPAEAGDEALVVDEVRAHDLERDLAVEPLVDAEVDGGHSAVGDATEHAVAAVEGAPDERVAGG